jgi:hypothetical protein
MNMTEDADEKLIKPIVNAAYPGGLASLSLAVLEMVGEEAPLILRIILSLDSILFILCAFFLFFYSIYPYKRILWTSSALTFLIGLILSFSAVIGIIIT